MLASIDANKTLSNHFNIACLTSLPHPHPILSLAPRYPFASSPLALLGLELVSICIGDRVD
jgi:hypothetical protein